MAGAELGDCSVLCKTPPLIKPADPFLKAYVLMSRVRSIVDRSLLHVEKLNFGMPVPGDGIARIASEFCAFGNIGPVFGGLGKRFLASSAVHLCDPCFCRPQYKARWA